MDAIGNRRPPSGQGRLQLTGLLAALVATTPASADPFGLEGLIISSPAPALLAATPTAGGGGEHYELYFKATGTVRSTKVDTDLRAGGRLLMRAVPGEGDLRTLTMVRPIEHPWRFWWNDPLIGRAANDTMAVVAVAGVGTSKGQPLMDRVAAEERAADAVGTAAHAAWRKDSGNGQAYGGTGHVWSVGDAAGRFTLTVNGARADMQAVSNQVTARWVPRALPRWRDGDLTAPERAGGYGRHDDSRAAPFWEPGTYKALAAACHLLEKSPFKDWSPAKTIALGKGGTYRLKYWNIPDKVARAADPMLGKGKGKLEASGHPELEFVVEDLDEGALQVRGRARGQRFDGTDGTYYMSRGTTYDRHRGVVVADWAYVDMELGDNRFTLEVGYHPYRPE